MGALKGRDDPLFLDFMKKALDWDPQVPLTPSQGLRHPWLRRKLPKPPANDSSSAKHKRHGSSVGKLPPAGTGGTKIKTAERTVLPKIVT